MDRQVAWLFGLVAASLALLFVGPVMVRTETGGEVGGMATGEVLMVAIPLALSVALVITLLRLMRS